MVERYDGRFELGVEYRLSGRQNISLARNLAIETASGMADWVAMTDDDCEPVPEWLEALFETERQTGAEGWRCWVCWPPRPSSNGSAATLQYSSATPGSG